MMLDYALFLLIFTVFEVDKNELPNGSMNITLKIQGLSPN